MIDINQFMKETISLKGKLIEFASPQAYYAPSVREFKESLEGKDGFVLKTTKKFWPLGILFYGSSIIMFPHLKLVREFNTADPQDKGLISGILNLEEKVRMPKNIGEFNDLTGTLYAGINNFYTRNGGVRLNVGQMLCSPSFALSPGTYAISNLMKFLFYGDINSYAASKEFGFIEDLVFSPR